jgi:hypothetical protein
MSVVVDVTDMCSTRSRLIAFAGISVIGGRAQCADDRELR